MRAEKILTKKEAVRSGRMKKAPRGRTPKAPRSHTRDQAPSTFASILEKLLAHIDGARAAVLVDFEGETVDYAGAGDPFEIKIAAAHWLIVLSEMRRPPLDPMGGLRKIIVRSEKRSFIVRRLHDEYALVVVLHPKAAFAASERAMVEAEIALAREAGWRRGAHAWHVVEVDTDRDVRPLRIRVGEAWQEIEVIGMVVGLGTRERGFRVRLLSGAEMMLVRERNGRWFSDENVDACHVA